MDFVGFPSIEGFHYVVKNGDYNKPVYNYRGKIKLHGTNAGVRLKDNEIAAQSRSQIITTTSDNAGFARWVDANKAYFASLQLANHTIFGEWCGKGIMKGTALNQLPNKIFAVFAVQIGVGDDALMVVNPEKIEQLLGVLPADMYVLPWCCDSFTVDFGKRVNMQETADALSKFVEVIEPVDPWVKSTFGVEGICEGAVYYPSDSEPIKRVVFEHFAFKAKGEKHAVIKTREIVQIAPEVAASIDGFVSMFVTEARLEQGLAAIGGDADMKNTGAFLKWFGQDVVKESVAELEAAGLTWEQVQKDVQSTARNWFKEKATAI